VPLKQSHTWSTTGLALAAAFGVAVGCDSAGGDVARSFPQPDFPESTAPPTKKGKPPEPLVGADSPCPGWIPPTPNSTCDANGAMVRGWDGTCEYGHDLEARCNDTLLCAGVWTLRPGDPKCFGRCPESFGEIVAGAPCQDARGCSYVEGTCACVAEPGDGGTTDAGVRRRWQCVSPPANGCPAQRPALGSDCVRPMTCDYGTCSLHLDLSFQCLQGLWIQADSLLCTGP
jgi:hypothetical protein